MSRRHLHSSMSSPTSEKATIGGRDKNSVPIGSPSSLRPTLKHQTKYVNHPSSVQQRKKKLNLPHFLGHPDKILPPFLIVATCCKVLLMPTYRSTDFDVHRNWLAITRHLPVSQWYFDDVNGTTVHTLDYPPAFAWFEWILSNNPITHLILPQGDRCLELLPDTDNMPSEACIIFHRSTVIVSDLILYAGAYLACRAMYHERPLHYSTLSFLLIVFNPGLLWLDHIHFQYNGMLLGLLLGSLGMLMMGNHVAEGSREFDLWHLGGAVLFATLVNLKHLYLPLAPLYFCYLLERYCIHNHSQFLPKRFLLLGGVTGTTLLSPWVPFLLQNDPKGQVLQILARMFPFGRGLVHDYWAANVWAVYTLANKVVRFVASRFPGLPPFMAQLPEPSPLACAILLFLSLLPGMYVAASRQRSNGKLIQAVVYSSFSTFMLAWHVHEKAIMTTMIPLTLLIEYHHPTDRETFNVLFYQVSLWGLLGLFPLLFTPVELAFKLVSYVTYVAVLSFLLFQRTGTSSASSIRRVQQRSAVILVSTVVFVLECLPIQGKWEFVPLMLTSIVCANGLIGCWALSLWLLLKDEKVKIS